VAERLHGGLVLVGTNHALLGKEWIITKAYDRPDGSVAIEGWISTPIKDLEKDILEPEAFMGEGMTTYFSKGAPVSSEHSTTGYPVGYLLKAALVRNGVILQQEDNPLHDKTDFLDFNGMGTGWYGLGLVDEPEAAANVRKGKVRSFSWIGHPNSWETLSDGGRRFVERGAINPLLETTITAYPINVSAMMRIAKAHGFAVEPAPEDQPKVKVYSIPTQALIDLVMNSQHVQEMSKSAMERAFRSKK
jgi:hypothetical protein